jgi:tRNA threonylcarbamoyladenosine biosynthesis protein TsaB
VLAIETATSDMRVALVDADGPLAEVAVCRQRRHAESLHPAIETVCRESGVLLRELSAVTVDIGPGLFTGLRVGVTTAKMLAVPLGLPVVTATSLSALARWASRVVSGAFDVLPVIDMRRGEVAWQPPGAGAGEISRGTPDELAVELRSARRLLLVGDGAVRYAETFRAASLDGSVLVAGSSAGAPQASTLGELAIERLILDSGPAELADPVLLVPLYLREADVAIGWESRTPVGSA